MYSSTQLHYTSYWWNNSPVGIGQSRRETEGRKNCILEAVYVYLIVYSIERPTRGGGAKYNVRQLKWIKYIYISFFY